MMPTWCGRLSSISIRDGESVVPAAESSSGPYDPGGPADYPPPTKPKRPVLHPQFRWKFLSSSLCWQRNPSIDRSLTLSEVRNPLESRAFPVDSARFRLVTGASWSHSEKMEYKKLKDQEDDVDTMGEDAESRREKAHSSAGINPLSTVGGSLGDHSKWKRKSLVTLALTFLTSSQAILIVWSKRAGKYEYSVTTANFLVEALKCFLSLAALTRIWRREGVTEDNRLRTTFEEVKVYPIPAALYLVKNLLQYYIFAYVDAPGYQILKNLNIISTGVLYRIILKRELSEIQWAAFILLCAGCTTAQLNSKSDRVLETPTQGWMMAIVMALLSGFAGVYTEAIIKKRPSRNINVQNFWLYIFGMIFNIIAILVQDSSAVLNKGFFHGYSFIIVLMIINHALSGIAVSMVMKYADNIVKVYSTSVAMLLTAVVSVFLFGFHLSLAFFLGAVVVSVSVYLHSVGKLRR